MPAAIGPLRIATRQSALALWQAEHVAARLRALSPDRPVVLVPMTTRGDRILDRSLAAIGGKGLFLKELEEAMAAGEADLAVHSLKDVPMALEPGFLLAAVLEREDPADAFVSGIHPSLDALPEGARVGTSSLRRQAQLRAARPDLELIDLRGNVNTRLARLDAGDYDAIVLAGAGLRRLGFAARIRERFDIDRFVPAVGQGAIALECRADDARTIALARALEHPATRRDTEAERAMNRSLHGSCQVPIAGHARATTAGLSLAAVVGDARSGELIRAQRVGDVRDPIALGLAVADALRAAGAERLLAQMGREP